MGNFRKLLSAICVGAILGTLTSATLVVGAAILVMFILPILFFPYVIWGAWAWGMQSTGYLPTLSVKAALLVAAIAVPLAAYIPYALARYEMTRGTANTPLPDDMALSDVIPDPVGNATTGPGVVYRFDPGEDMLGALRRYSRTLQQEGWNRILGEVPAAIGFNVSLMFSNPSHRHILIHADWNRTAHEYENVDLRVAFSPRAPVVLLALLVAVFLLPFGFALFRDKKGSADER
jgi:hypothetical protein